MSADYFRFRLPALAAESLDALAASPGKRSVAAREALHYWHAAVAEAGRVNADEFGPADWEALAHTGDPADYGLTHDESYPHWPHWLARGLADGWEGRAVVLPEHVAARDAARELAGRVDALDAIRGYAMMAALRWFWRHSSTAGAWFHPECWLIPETPADAAGV